MKSRTGISAGLLCATTAILHPRLANHLPDRLLLGVQTVKGNGVVALQRLF